MTSLLSSHEYIYYIIGTNSVNSWLDQEWNRPIRRSGVRWCPMVQEEIQQLLHMMRVAMRMLDMSNREVEKRLELSYGYLSRLFSGNI